MDGFPLSIKRNDFEAILSHLLEGLIVVDSSGRVVWINPAAEAIVGLRSDEVRGRPACDIFEQPELRELLSQETPAGPERFEIGLAEGRIFGLKITPLSEGGFAVIFQVDPSYTVIEQSKKECVNFIAHELRSPLTAILGYAELIALASPVTPRQAGFIRQIQVCVQKINSHLFSTDGIGPSPPCSPGDKSPG